MVGIKNLALFAGAILPAFGAPTVDKRASQIVPNSYIVTLKQGVSPQGHISWVNSVHKRSEDRKDTKGVHKVFDIQDFKGYSGTFDQATLDKIKKNPDVAMVEPNSIVKTTGFATQSNAPWGLSSISHRWGTTGDYVYDDSAGAGTYAYLLDTGVQVEHVELEGRAFKAYNAFAAEAPDVDVDGHGTHTAGTIASRAYGVAKKATVYSVKVLHNGSGSWETVLDGYSWAVGNITTSNRAAVSVISMSLGGGRLEAFNTAVNAAYKAGVLSVVAAGNDGSDAKDTSPASSQDALTIGAIDISNTMAWFSNWGRIVDIFAPGVDVESSWIGDSNTETNIISGTSMATPHVAGLVLYLKGQDPVGMRNPGTVSRKIKSLGTEGMITDIAKNTKNLLAFNGAPDS